MKIDYAKRPSLPAVTACERALFTRNVVFAFAPVIGFLIRKYMVDFPNLVRRLRSQYGSLFFLAATIAITLPPLRAATWRAESVPARSAQAAIEKRIDELLARMTLEEKLSQLQMLDGLAEGVYRPEHPEMIR